MASWKTETVAERPLRVWKVVHRKNQTIAVVAAEVPEGAQYEISGSCECVELRVSGCHVILGGRWVQADDAAVFVPDPQPQEAYESLLGLPPTRYVVGAAADADNGLWFYKDPWQTYWPFTGPPYHRRADASAIGWGIWEITAAELRG